MQSALVTGATGFIGQHLTRRLLAEGVEVRCLVRSVARGEPLRGDGATLVPGDVVDDSTLRSAIGDVDTVFHLAGLTKATRTRSLWDVNEKGTRNVAAACAARPNPPAMVYVSSLAAAGPCIEGRPRTEREAATPVSNYGRSKYAGEIASAEFADETPITVVRPPIVLGPGDRDGFELFRTIARWRTHLVPGRGDEPYSVIHAEDLTSALIAAARRGKRLGSRDPLAGVYFVAADEQVTYAKLGQMVSRAVGVSPVRIVRSPAATVWGVATANELIAQLTRKPRFLGLDKAREATAGGWACDDRLIRRDTGFTPARSLQDRIDETAAWYREKAWLPRP